MNILSFGFVMYFVKNLSSIILELHKILKVSGICMYSFEIRKQFFFYLNGGGNIIAL